MTIITARCFGFSILAALASGAAALRAEAPPLLRPGPTIEIAGAAGKFDFLEIDSTRRRLLGAHEKAETADFFDLNTNQLLARLDTGPAVHVAADDKDGKYFVSATEQKKVVV